MTAMNIEPPASIVPSTAATRADGTQSFFFFGTLMVPAILTRVLGHSGGNLTFQDAILPGYVRHAVKGVDYPAVVSAVASSHVLGRGLTEDESCVRGTYVSGLSNSDVKALDVFEGDEYIRKTLPVRTLSDPSMTKTLDPKIPVPVNRPGKPYAQSGNEESAWVYVWDKEIACLEKEIWDFDSFLKDKSSHWIGSGPPSTPNGLIARSLQESSNTSYTATIGDEKIVDWYEQVDRMRSLGLLDGEELNVLPAFGKGLLRFWKFDKNYINLNHGSYGSPPIPVLNAMHRLSDQCESNPDLFMRKSYLPLLTDVRKQLAEMVNADVEDCVIVPNATVGINTVTWNIDWMPGDVIVAYSTTYGAVNQTLKHICDKFNTTLVEIPLAFPMYHSEILAKTEAVLAELNAVGGSPLQHGRKAKMVVIDSIASNPGMVMPWEGVVDLCKKYGVLSLVDAAHSIGQLPVDLKKAGCDFWVSNCHKWLLCHRGVALFYVNKDKQHLIRTSVPTSAFYESKKYPTPGGRAWTFQGQWDWTGTQDWSPSLSIPAAIEFRKYLGGETRINEYCHGLALAGGAAAARIIGTDVMENDKGELTANMVNVRLPNMPMLSGPAEVYLLLNYFTQGQFQANTFTAVYWHNNSWWARMSAQVWNEISDFEKCAEVLLGLSKFVQDGGDWKQKAAATCC